MKTISILLAIFLVSPLGYCAWKSYAVEQPDGTVRIHSYNDQSSRSFEEYLELAGDSGKPIREVTAESVPKDKEYRAAWKLTSDGVVVDQGKKNQIDAKKTEKTNKQKSLKQKLGLNDAELETLKELLR